MLPRHLERPSTSTAIPLAISAGLLAKHVAWIEATPGWSMLFFPIIMVVNGWLLRVIGKMGYLHEATANSKVNQP
ncbi:MAG: hypothetical protein JWO82_4277 [Akkermansiaceae bacterium]|nr:hypothetical protein [Akkermansiaceae bacterium]